MRPKTPFLPALAAVAIVVGSGYVHGLWSFRWSATREIEAASEKLARVPKSFGDWSGTDTPLDEHQIKLARIDASVSRRYVDAKTGRAMSVLIVCGRPGPISAHTPDVCYTGSGFEVASDRSKVSVDFGGSKPAEFWSIRVSKPDLARPERMIIDYGWFAGGSWSAPAVDARFQFASHPVLFKMYVIREQSRSDERPDFDPSAEFLKQFLPELQKVLGPTA